VFANELAMAKRFGPYPNMFIEYGCPFGLVMGLTFFCCCAGQKKKDKVANKHNKKSVLQK